jgi:hypothetical protein
MKKLFIFILVLIMLPFAFAQNPLMDGLVTYYKLDEISGTNAQDYFNLNNGTANNARVFTSEIAGQINTGADFTQGNDQINTNFVPVTNNDFTWNFWIKTSDSSSSFILGSQSGNTVGVTVQFGDWGIGAFSGASTGTRWLGTGTTTSSISTVAINNNTWNMVTIVRFTNSSGGIYVNGNLVHQGAWNPYDSGSTNLFLGQRGNGAGYMNGFLDEFAIYNRSLSAQEVENLYNAQKDGFESGQPPFSQDFIITARNSVTNAQINTFNATINDVFYSTTNGTINTPYLLNESFLANILVDSNGFFSRTYNSYQTDTSLNALLQPIGTLDIIIKNQASNNLITDQVNITLQSSTQEFNYQTSTGQFLFTNLNLNEQYNVFLKSASFIDNQYSFTYTSSTPNPFNMFMALNTTIGSEIKFNVIDTENSPINDVTVRVDAFVNGTYQTISQKTTDLSGDALFILEQGKTHRIVFSKNGFVTQEFISQLPLQTYSVVLQKDAFFDFVGVTAGVSYAYAPTSLILNPSVNQEFNWSVSTVNNDLFQYRIRLFNGTNLLAEQSGNNPSGSLITLNFDTTPYNNSNLRAVYSFTKANFTIYELTVFYNIAQISDESIFSMNQFMKENISLRDRIIIFSVIMLALILIFSLFGNAVAVIMMVAMLSPIVSWMVGLSTIIIGFMSILIMITILANRGNLG